MPIFLDDLASTVATTPIYTPKFFSSELTGRGTKTQGVLNMEINPIATQKVGTQQPLSNVDTIMCKRKYYINGKNIQDVPFYFIKNTYMGPNNFITKLTVPSVKDMQQVATTKQNPDLKWYLTIEPYSLTIQKEDNGSSSSSQRSQQVYYYVRICQVNQDPQKPEEWNIVDIYSDMYDIAKKENVVWQHLTREPYKVVEEALKNLSGYSAYNYEDIVIDIQAAMSYLDNYSTYEAICRRSELWQTEADKIINNTISHLWYEYNITSSKGSQTTICEIICEILRYLETYSIPLSLYKNIYQNLETTVQDTDMLKMFCNQNMNLLLHRTLFALENNKDQLEKLPIPQTEPTLNPKLSIEQKKAVSTKEPLALVQAGAGTGKSTVILNRIKYMVDCGVDPNDITVLSFTNAAADHIKDLNPNVHSMTIASMIHSIYTLNFKEHTLSTPDTIVNSIDIFCQNWPYGDDFKKVLKDMVRKKPNAFTQLNNFVENNKQEVLDILDKINQTSLELEIILCYQNLDNLIEPDEIKSKHLIVDEVQDNSIFEFIYTLIYVNKHKESLFWVGDASQCLYEFRAANPKALNVLEASKVFATYQLQTNYRSNQEILDFANITLANIEANQYANIRLKANSLVPVTLDSFKEKVHVNYTALDKMKDLEYKITEMLTGPAHAYITDKYNKHEQVVFLAHKRAHGKLMRDILEKQFPQAKIMTITSQRSHAETFLSKYINACQNDIKFFPIKCFSDMLLNDMIDKIPSIMNYTSGSAKEASTQRLVNKYMSKNKSTIDNWVSQIQNGVLPHDIFIENVKENIIQYEISTNGIRQALLNEKNRENKENQNTQDADFVISTIHGAKGLEFEHAVILYAADNNLPEEKKRMYYVAFTRPQKSEFILAYGKVKNPKIMADYQIVLDQLKDRQITTAIQS